MKVGDLVKCFPHAHSGGVHSPACVIGLIISIKPNVHSVVTKRSIFKVLLGGDIYPFRSDMLEAISGTS